jgi:hypothetical protein
VGERVAKGWRDEVEPYPELGEGVVAGKNGIFDIAPVIEAPLTLILSPRFAGGEERREAHKIRATSPAARQRA